MAEEQVFLKSQENSVKVTSYLEILRPQIEFDP